MKYVKTYILKLVGSNANYDFHSVILGLEEFINSLSYIEDAGKKIPVRVHIEESGIPISEYRIEIR